MEKEIKMADEKKEGAGESGAHREAVEFVERHRDLFEHYARGRVNFAPAPPELNTFATDLETGTLYVNSRFYESEGHALGDEKTSFATLHEAEHLQEKVLMLEEPNGAREFERYLRRVKESEAYSLMDNCVADVRENKTVISRTHEGFAAIEQSLYSEDLFPSNDFTEAPRHIQFSQALLRESRLAEECVVHPDVRAKLNELLAITSPKGARLWDVMTDPRTPMSLRLKLQDRYIWPMVKELREKDLEDKKGKPKKGKEGKSKGEKAGKKAKSKPSQEKENEAEANEAFSEDYAKAKKQMPHAVPIKEMEKALKEWKESRGESPADKADKEYANRLGVKKEDLQRYRNIVASLERVVNPETNVSVIEELRNLIRRIIARRLKPAPAPRYPVEEGEELVDPTELITQFKAGNLEPKAWETTEIRETRGKKFGEVEITLVCDRSSSMRGAKLLEQQKAAVLMMESLKEFAEECDAERVNMDKPLEVRSEIFSFQQTAEDSTPLKPMSKELGEKQRIEVASILSSAPGGTTDFVPLETISRVISEEDKQKTREGELKKIVIVFTDGDSNDEKRVRRVLEELREKGVVVIGVGITEEGRPALTTYAPEARLAPKAEDLAPVLGELLKEHLADVRWVP